MPIQSLVLFGTVLDTKDPDKLGRVKVELRGFGAALETPWLRMLQGGASDRAGHLFLPEVGDEVAVLRGMGDYVQGMLVMGCLYSGRNQPATPDADGKNNVKEIRTRAGSLLTFDDTDGEERVTLSAKDGKLRVELSVKDGAITIQGDQEVVVKAQKKVSVSAEQVEVKGSQKVVVDGGPQVEIKGSSAVKIQGGQVQLSGQAIQLG